MDKSLNYNQKMLRMGPSTQPMNFLEAITGRKPRRRGSAVSISGEP